ncbi:MAG: OmpA family protein [Magnetococcales bacterium]|nr:OmpA family protein [Magnetococcales bacterium]
MKHLKLAVLAGAALLLASAPFQVEAATIGGWSHKGFTQWHPQDGKSGLGATGTQCYFCKPDAVVDGDDDGDGVPNSRDKCPNTPKGTKVDSDGCPVVGDEDGDGVLDPDDKCPGTPKGATVNKQGCWIIKNLNFRFDSAKIENKDKVTLKSAASVLKQNPALKVEIQGHTDNVGTDAYNQKLSERRAHSVMKGLVQQGIKKDRLTARGYGESKPVATNDTAEGRAENRRVELNVIK